MVSQWRLSQTHIIHTHEIERLAMLIDERAGADTPAGSAVRGRGPPDCTQAGTHSKLTGADWRQVAANRAAVAASVPTTAATTSMKTVYL